MGEKGYVDTAKTDERNQEDQSTRLPEGEVEYGSTDNDYDHAHEEEYAHSDESPLDGDKGVRVGGFADPDGQGQSVYRPLFVSALGTRAYIRVRTKTSFIIIGMNPRLLKRVWTTKTLRVGVEDDRYRALPMMRTDRVSYEHS